MYLDEIVRAQKGGEARGVPSVCSAHPQVLCEALKAARSFGSVPLVEATCNQVNQFGGYTGMTPAGFVAFMRGLALEIGFPFDDIILGGDHLGPSVWQGEPAGLAMQKAMELVRHYAEAGFTKIHLDCSMRLADDPPGGPLDVELSAQRAAQLAQVAEQHAARSLRYVIGTEVPIPGGAQEHETGLHITTPDDARQTIEVTGRAFQRAGLDSAWQRVIALVVQPGVEFGDDFVVPYQSEAGRLLSRFIESEALIYEAHSTDYQSPQALRQLVQDHFGILKVGPALTFAYRAAIFALAAIEDGYVAANERSNVIGVLEAVMVENPRHWDKYYRGTAEEQAFKRKFSLSDRIRYYWTDARVQQALAKLFDNLGPQPIPASLLRGYAPGLDVPEEVAGYTPAGVVSASIQRVLRGYYSACQG